MKIKKLNESSTPSKETLDDCLQDYVNNAFGYDGVQDYVDTQYPMHPQEFKSEVINYLKQNIINESISESISSQEPVVKFTGRSSHTFTKDKKWEIDFDEKGNILARTRKGKPQYFKGHINDKTNSFPSTDEDNIILAAREQHSLKFGKGSAVTESLTESRPDKDYYQNNSTNKVTIKYGNSNKEIQTCKPIKVTNDQLKQYKDNYSFVDIINESKSMSEDTSYEWKPNTSFKHIKDIYNKVKENNYKYVNNEREEFMAAVMKAHNKGYKPEQCRQIKDWHRDICQHNKKNESFDVDKVQKRIARHNEFDNGYVLHDWQNMTSQEAEDKAREASIKNPDDIYYVAYDNIMEPASDIKWKNGKQIDESFNDNWNQRFKGMKVFINGDFQIKSVYFADGTEGWELGTWTDSGRYKVIDRFSDIDEAKQKAYDLKHPLGEDLDNKYELYNDYVITRDLAGDGYNVYSYDSYKDKLVLEDEGFATKQDAKNAIDKWVAKNILSEDVDDDKWIIQRYLDVEIPDTLSRLIDFLPKMYESDIKIVKNHCRRFYDQFNSMLSYYVAHKDGPYIELEDTSIIDELGFAGAVEMKGSKVCADEETLRQLCDAIHSEYGWQPKIEESLNESNINLEDRYNTLLAAYGRELRDLMNTSKDGCNDDKIKEMQDKIADTKKKISSALKEHVEITALEGPEEGPKVGLSSLLTDAIKDEWEAIETYNSLAVTARAEGFEDIANAIDEINTDENTHVGKLQELLKTISPNAEAIEFGQDHVDHMDDDMSEDDVLAYTDRYM